LFRTRAEGGFFFVTNTQKKKKVREKEHKSSQFSPFHARTRYIYKNVREHFFS
jgi:hypothetical protein